MKKAIDLPVMEETICVAEYYYRPHKENNSYIDDPAGTDKVLHRCRIDAVTIINKLNQRIVLSDLDIAAIIKAVNEINNTTDYLTL